MSPHGTLLLVAAVLGFGGKLVFRNATLRVVLAAALALPLALLLWSGETPSPIGLAIGAPLSLAGGVAGVALAGLVLGRVPPFPP